VDYAGIKTVVVKCAELSHGSDRADIDEENFAPEIAGGS
jgi:hypothetical protein